MKITGAQVIEVVSNWPAEVFIQRHISALQAYPFALQLVARHQSQGYSESASVEASGSGMEARIMPNFDHFSLSEKLASVRYLVGAKSSLKNHFSYRDQVLLAFFEHLEPRLIHFHTASLASAMRWIPAALGIPYTLSLRGSDVQIIPLKSKENSGEIAAALQGAARIHAVCDHLGDVAAQLSMGPLDFQTIYTTVPIPDTLPEVCPRSSAGIHLVSSGRIHWTKGFPDLLAALRILLDKGYQARLSIIGNGPDEERLRYGLNCLGLETNVTFTGKLGYQEIKQLLSQASAYIQSSIAEGLSNALVEAMALGCPVFATRAGGTAEIIHDGKNGFLLEPLAPEKWADKLLLVNDPSLMDLIRTGAYQTAIDFFSPASHAVQFADFYQKALANGHRPQPVQAAAKEVIPNEKCGDHKILVTGAWNWQNQPDAVLRLAGKLKMECCWRLIGSGPQADELRYLANYFHGNSSICVIETGPNESQAALHHGLAWQEILVDIGTPGGWKVSFSGDEIHLPAGDVSGLEKCLLGFFDR